MEFNRGDLEPAEQDLVDALEAGTVYGPETGDRDTWPVVRAQTIRNLLRGVYQDVIPDPKGLRLRRVRIDGRIDLDHVDTSIPLKLDECDLPGGLTASHAGLPTLLIHGMTIERPATDEAVLHVDHLSVGEMELTGTTLTNEQGPALIGDELTVESGVFLDDGFTATGHGHLGAVRMVGATIGGQLVLSGATLTNETGPALSADGITVAHDVFLHEGFTATGHGDMGAVRMVGATIGGQLVLSGATLTNETNSALIADGISVVQDAYIDGGFTATGHEHSGTVRMIGATICGQLILNTARFFGSAHGRPTVVLQGAEVRSSIVIDKKTLEREATSSYWNIRGLTYSVLGVDDDLWLRLLRTGTDEYLPQPYQQFAAVARASGDEKLTRRILIAQYNDHLARSREVSDLLTRGQRAGLRVLKYTVGYGYRTWLALVWLALVVGIAVAAAFTFGSNDWLWGWGWDWAAAALHQPTESKAGTPGAPCRPVDLVVLGLETIPLIPLVAGGGDRCFVTNSPAGATFLGISVFLKIVAWALAALFVAGYTSIVRNPGP